MTDKKTHQDDIQKIYQEYQDFAYIVSHDLNAPLRHVKEFTRLLIASRIDNLSLEEKEYVSHLERSLKRLDHMQDGLLAFSRVNTLGRDFENTDTNTIVEQALHSLEGEVVEYNVDVKTQDLPAIKADPKQALTVFHNIIENAFKFHQPGSNRSIEISASEKDEQITFQITDNGIGIEEQFLHDIFRIFRRLHVEDEFPGQGYGLTIAKKIVERHGGKIWAESELGKGTSIFFSFPKA